MKQPTLDDAVALAKKAHAGQMDKAGSPYFGHLERVMNSVEGKELKIIAVLHDSLEDTYLTREHLQQSGYSEHVIAAIESLTKRHDEEGSDDGYERFIHRAAQNPLARIVKIADLKDNMDLSRIKDVTNKDRRRVAKYECALQYLQATG